MNDNELSDQLIEKEKKIGELYAEIRKIDAERDEAVRKALLWDNWYKELYSRHESKLKTVYYLLEQLEKVGTHHEKEVVIRYMRMLLEGFMKQDSMPWERELFPF